MAADFYRDLGRRIAERRRAVNLTQEAVAASAGIGASYLAHIEAGRKKPTLDTLRNVAGALSVEPWQLLTDERTSSDEKLWRTREQKLAEKVRALGKSELELLLSMATKLGRARRD